MAKNIYYRDGCLLTLGCFLLVPTVIGFLVSSMFNHFNYSVSTSTNTSSSTQYIYSDKNLEEVRKENPGKKVAKIEKGFPVKSTVFLFLSLSLIIYSRMVKRKEKNIIKLWDLLEQNRKLDLKTLTQKFGYSQEFILEALHYINKHPNASFTYHADTDLIYDDGDTVEWHLAENCQSCGGAVNEKVFISMSTESFSCPYCSSPIIDPKFLEYKKKKEETKNEQIHGVLGSFVNNLVEKAMEGKESQQSSIQRDPVKANVSWRPLKGGGSNFATRKIKVLDSDRAEFKPTVFSLLFNLIFAAAGTFIIIAVLSADKKMELSGLIMGVLFGAVFAGVGFGMMWFSLKPVIFDKSMGYFWKGRKSPDDVINIKELKECVALKDILALQIIKEYCSGSSSNGRRSKSYYSYELNLVLKDNSRINVFDHGGYNRAVSDSKRLAEFLGVPLWDDDL